MPQDYSYQFIMGLEVNVYPGIEIGNILKRFKKLERDLKSPIEYS